MDEDIILIVITRQYDDCSSKNGGDTMTDNAKLEWKKDFGKL